MGRTIAGNRSKLFANPETAGSPAQFSLVWFSLVGLVEGSTTRHKQDEDEDEGGVEVELEVEVEVEAKCPSSRSLFSTIACHL